MTEQIFKELTTRLTERRADIVCKKRPEYTESQDDVLYNFKQTARELGIEPEKVCYIFLRKHLASISQLSAGLAADSESYHDRFADAINYLELLYALIWESKNLNFPIP